MAKNYNSNLQSNNTDLQAILNTINELPNAGGSVETVEQATPSITVNSSTGLITATATQTAGYVAAGTKSATHQLAFQAAQTITPGTTNKTIAANTYLGGVQTIKGDANLVASNIVKGKSIFGVAGTATAGADPFTRTAPFTYTVDSISGASYGFALNSNGYYESQNKGVHNSYAICRVNLTVVSSCDIVFSVINYAEQYGDYSIFSELDSPLEASTAHESGKKAFWNDQPTNNIVNITYTNVPVGNHYIDVKFVKDDDTNANNDSVQFKIREEEAVLPQTTINKILASDQDLVSGNIKSGVNIFGITGTYEAGGDVQTCTQMHISTNGTSYGTIYWTSLTSGSIKFNSKTFSGNSSNTFMNADCIKGSMIVCVFDGTIRSAVIDGGKVEATAADMRVVVFSVNSDASCIVIDVS